MALINHRLTKFFFRIRWGAGDENLVVGTDYGHTDTSAEIEALRILREGGTVAAASVDKILGPNSERLYGLN